MENFVFESVDESYAHLVQALLDNGKEVSPRGMLTKELSPVSITINNPRKRVITHPVRKLNYGFMVAELLWILRGSNDMEEISFYNKQWAKFSDDGATLNGAYGQRIFKYSGLEQVTAAGHTFYHPTEVNQFDAVVERLKKDPDSRHGTIVLWDPTKDTKDSKDLPCTNLLRFKVRDGKVDMIAFMRSNDIWFGYPYDVFNFTMLQELMAGKLGLEVGTYTHVADSFHLYEMHFDVAKELVAAGPTDTYANKTLTDARISPDKFDELINSVQTAELVSRKSIRPDDNFDHYRSYLDAVKVYNNDYWTSLAGVIVQYNLKKSKDDPSPAFEYITNEFSALVNPKEDTKLTEKQPNIVDAEIVEETKNVEAAETATQDEQPKGIQKITIETDGTLENTKIMLDEQAVPMLIRAEFIADVNEGVVLRLNQIVVDEEGKPKTGDDGQVQVNTFTIARQQQTQVEEAANDGQDIATPAADLLK